MLLQSQDPGLEVVAVNGKPDRFASIHFSNIVMMWGGCCEGEKAHSLMLEACK